MLKAEIKSPINSGHGRYCVVNLGGSRVVVGAFVKG